MLTEEAATSNGKSPARDRQFVLGVDLDSVCADFTAGLKVIAAEFLHTSVDDLPDEVTRDYPEWGLLDDAEFEALYEYAAARQDLFRHVPAINGAAPTLRRLKERHGLRIRVITHRLYFKRIHRHVVSQTVEWLDRRAFPYDDFCVIEDKTAVLADLYIDDSPSVVKALREQNPPRDVIAYMTSQNGHLAEPRAWSWDEVEKLVDGFVTAWKQ